MDIENEKIGRNMKDAFNRKKEEQNWQRKRKS